MWWQKNLFWKFNLAHAFTYSCNEPKVFSDSFYKTDDPLGIFNELDFYPLEERLHLYVCVCMRVRECAFFCFAEREQPLAALA